MVWPAAGIGFGPPCLVFVMVNDGPVFWVTGGGRVLWLDLAPACGGNTVCCVYQIYASIDVWLGGGVIDGVGPISGNVQLAIATDAFGGTWQHAVVSIWQYIANVDACLGLLPVLVTTMV